MVRTTTCAALLVLGGALPALAQKEPELDKKRVEAAIKKGLAWLKTKQAANGSFDEGYQSQFPTGPTALVALTMAKVGDPKDKSTRAAWHYLQSAPLKKTYGAGILLMALEAKFAPSKSQLLKSADPYKSAVRKRAKKAKAPDKRLMGSAAGWLIKTKATPMWGYPGMPGGEWDHSNTQYALLGLGSASRMGWRPPPRPLFEVLDALLANQEKTGPDVKPFFVPAAEASFKEIDKLAKALAKARAKTGTDDPARNGSRPRIREFHETYKPGPMKARGWAYLGLPNGLKSKHPAEAMPNYHQPNNSMTAACLAAVIVLKSLLERAGAYKKRYKKRVDQAIRDGAAYLAKNWSLDDPGGHPYYYLYGLERVGVLTGCHQFGDHWWYHEGGKKLLGMQNSDGSWGSPQRVANGGFAQKPNALPQTCFAILFLARATVPLVPKLPPRPTTGR